MTQQSAVSRREGTRLEVDDPYHCKWCGGELPKMLVDGPIAGEGTQHPPVELCGDCEGERTTLLAKAVKRAQEKYGVLISTDAIGDPPESWDLSTELWYSWSAEVQAQRIEEEEGL